MADGPHTAMERIEALEQREAARDVGIAAMRAAVLELGAAVGNLQLTVRLLLDTWDQLPGEVPASRGNKRPRVN